MKFVTKIQLLIFTGFLASEFHQFYKRGVPVYINWFIVQPQYPPTLRWYLHDTGMLARNLLWTIAATLMAAKISGRLKWYMTVIIFYCIGDIFLYVYCFQLYGYVWLYLLTGALSLIAIYRQ